MELGPAAGRRYAGPRDETERRLVEIWAEVLKIAPEQIGIEDNFFELGGHSLLATRLTAKVEKRFGRRLALASLFVAPNIASLAGLIAERECRPTDVLVPIQPKGDGLPVFAVPGAGGNVLSLRPLGAALGRDRPLFGFQAAGLDGKSSPFGSVEETAEAYISALKERQPTGPYTLAGHSYGGVVGYEMARRLAERGEEIGSLILLDSIAPPVIQSMAVPDAAGELREICTALAAIYGVSLDTEVDLLPSLPDQGLVPCLVGLLEQRGIEIDAGQFSAFYSVYRANLECYRAYKPAPLSRKVDVVLYAATRRKGLVLPDDYGWNDLVESPIRVQAVDADHHSIMEKVNF
jgi:thioesterase domain-containing protein/acyl carrier protein